MLSINISSVFSFVFFWKKFVFLCLIIFCKKKLNFNVIELFNIGLIGFLKIGLVCFVVNKGIEGN